MGSSPGVSLCENSTSQQPWGGLYTLPAHAAHVTRTLQVEDTQQVRVMSRIHPHDWLHSCGLAALLHCLLPWCKTALDRSQAFSSPGAVCVHVFVLGSYGQLYPVCVLCVLVHMGVLHAGADSRAAS